jgi:hypothetical protein
MIVLVFQQPKDAQLQPYSVPVQTQKLDLRLCHCFVHHAVIFAVNTEHESMIVVNVF